MPDPYPWFALKSVPMVGNVTFRRLLDRFGSPERVFRATAGELSGAGIGPAAVSAILSHDHRSFAEQECERLRSAGARIVTLLDREYPRLLKEISDPPPFLYLLGELKGEEPGLAIVGSRRVSTYGKVTTARLAGELAERGITVISGMARGVDTAAHAGALENGGRSIGVLGCGIDVVYPPENQGLFRAMSEHGALVSEFPMGTLPLAENFPRRNRIISGLSHGVLVVEAMEQSGSLITAQFALDQGRELFAVPGNINTSSSRGCNRLIKQGAKLVESVEDILEELPGWARPARKDAAPAVSLTEPEARIFALFDKGPLHIDEIIVQSGIAAGEISSLLLGLELKGVVQQLPGKTFIPS